MIATTAKHGRTPQDSSNLLAHLIDEENEQIEILEIGHSVAVDLAGVLRDLEIHRAGSRAQCAIHHMSVNPSQQCKKEQLLDAANRLRLEFDPDDERPYITIRHRKQRSDPNAAVDHAHLVLGNVVNGKALDDHLSKIRSEVVARIWEFTNCENPVASRHHKKVLKILGERGRHDVQQWLIEKLGDDPEEPSSAMSSNTRMRAKRVGVNLPREKAAIVSIWNVTKGMPVFRAALADAGYAIVPGDKANVWVVLDRENNLIGSLDRLLKKKRHEIRSLLEAEHDILGDRNIRTVVKADAALGNAIGRPGYNGLRSNRGHSAISGNLGSTGGAPDQNSLSDRSETRRITRLDHNRALGRIRRLGRSIGQSAILVSRHQQRLEEIASESQEMWVGAVDLWGIPIPPPKKKIQP